MSWIAAFIGVLALDMILLCMQFPFTKFVVPAIFTIAVCIALEIFEEWFHKN